MLRMASRNTFDEECKAGIPLIGYERADRRSHGSLLG